MLNKNIVSFLGCDAEYDEARVVLFGAPFDSTTSFRPGTRFAGPAIRGDSWGLETYSPYQDRDLTDCHIFDSGDLELAIGDSEKVLAVIEERAETILKDDKLPFLIGGEHLVTLGSIRAAARKYPDLHRSAGGLSGGSAFPCLRDPALLGDFGERKDSSVWNSFWRKG